MIRPELIEDAVQNITEAEVKALFELDEYYGVGPTKLALHLGWDKPTSARILRSLRDKGLATYGYLGSEDDGLLYGRGYWVEDFGAAVKARLIEMEDSGLLSLIAA